MKLIEIYFKNTQNAAYMLAFVSSFIPYNIFVTSRTTEIDSKHIKINNFE